MRLGELVANQGSYGHAQDIALCDVCMGWNCYHSGYSNNGDFHVFHFDSFMSIPVV
jgi:hypothetical protein